MRKTLVPILAVLGFQLVSASLAKEKDLLTSDKGFEIDKHLNEYAFSIEKITEYTKTEITEFWKNKTNGEYCTSLFVKIVEHYAEVKKQVYEINAWVDEYNTKCSDKCLPGYVRCEGDYSGKCIAECDCCASHYLNCCQGTNNHPASSYNYATGEGETLHCYDWCCPEDHTYCGEKCIPDGASMGYGNGPADHPSEFPKVCCNGQDCCDAGETYIRHLTTDAPFCCTLDEVFQTDKYDDATCCCNSKDEICCPNLDHHCQPKTNVLCCGPHEIDCHGECWPADKPCCDAPAFNCEHQYNACVEYCCCENSEVCCEARKECIPKDSLCCEWDEVECYGKCIGKYEHCCPHEAPWCEYTNSCSEHCCDVANGYHYCEWTYKCELHCCKPGEIWCEYTNTCLINHNECCPYDKPYCKHTDSCQEHCCEYNQHRHDIWCEIKKACVDECNCCQDGFEACKCESGTYNAITTCYPAKGKECCDHFWCEATHACLSDEHSCCVASGKSYVGDVHAPYKADFCCPYGDNAYSYGVEGENDIVGCCNVEAGTCCREPEVDELQVTFNILNGHCTVVPKQPCPCEGCCDFNCCDELDFFMHRAYYDHYNTEY